MPVCPKLVWLTLLVLGSTAAAGEYQCPRKVFLRGVANTADAPLSPIAGSTYTISPALPAGLSLDANTGVISGTPTAVSPLTDYTVQATNCLGKQSVTVSLRTADGYLVNDLSDAAYMGPGCVSTSGTCTLRAAVAAVGGTPAQNVILLPPGSIVLGSQLAPTVPMDIYGDCAQRTTLDGNMATRVLNLVTGPDTFENLTVQNALITSGNGGGILITNSSHPTFTVALYNDTFKNNQAPGGGGVCVTAASGTQQVILDVSHCLFTGNSATANFGGGIEFTNGNDFTQAVIDSTTFDSNHSVQQGAGIFYAGNSISVTHSTFSRNDAPGANASAFDINAIAQGTLAFVDDTFYANTGAKAVIYQARTVELTNCTFLDNVVSEGVLDPLGLGTVELWNNLFLHNTLADGTTLANCNGTSGIFSHGGNLSDDAASDCGLTGADFPSTLALLGPLQDNGGPTQTLALLPGSPGLDAGLAANCPSDDQRGEPRRAGFSCDIGAFQTEPTLPDAGPMSCPGTDGGSDGGTSLSGRRHYVVGCACGATSAGSWLAVVAVLCVLLLRRSGA